MVRARGEPPRTTSAPSLLKPCVDDVPRRARAETPAAGDLPTCRSLASPSRSRRIPKPSRSIASGALRAFVEAASMPIGLGKFSPKARSAISDHPDAAGWRNNRRPGSPLRWASAGSNARSNGSEKASKARITASTPKSRYSLVACAPVDERSPRNIEFAVDMRE